MEKDKAPEPAWCPGCGDYGILNAVKKVLHNIGKAPEEVVLVSGIGQAAKLPHYVRANVFNGLHGRALPAAIGVKLANHNLTVLAVGGDGDMYGEGGNHFLHAIRRNVNITLLVHDNKIYGLTKGQASPTTDIGTQTKLQPLGVINQPLNPLTLAISQRCSFVARSFAGAPDHLAEIIQAGIEHPGFAYIEILQPCVSFNKVNTYAWYKERVFDVSKDTKYDHTNFHTALDAAEEWGARIPIGILYKHIRPTYEEQAAILKLGPLLTGISPALKVKEFLKTY